MSVPGSRPRLVVLATALMIVSACGGGVSATSSPTNGAAGGTSSTPAAATNVLPGGATPTPPAAGSNPVIADGTFTTGKFHAVVRGDVSLILDAPLQGGISMTAAGSTVLNYIDGKTAAGGAVTLSPEGSAITISAPAVTTVGTSAAVGGGGCVITVTTSDAARVNGSFDCHALPGTVLASRKTVTIDVQGTFEANR
jgi:hypothetical protein